MNTAEEFFYADENELCGDRLQETRDGQILHVANFHRVLVQPVQQKAKLTVCCGFVVLAVFDMGIADMTVASGKRMWLP